MRDGRGASLIRSPAAQEPCRASFGATHLDDRVTLRLDWLDTLGRADQIFKEVYCSGRTICHKPPGWLLSYHRDRDMSSQAQNDIVFLGMHTISPHCIASF